MARERGRQAAAATTAAPGGGGGDDGGAWFSFSTARPIPSPHLVHVVGRVPGRRHALALLAYHRSSSFERRGARRLLREEAAGGRVWRTHKTGDRGSATGNRGGMRVRACGGTRERMGVGVGWSLSRRLIARDLEVDDWLSPIARDENPQCRLVVGGRSSLVGAARLPPLRRLRRLARQRPESHSPLKNPPDFVGEPTKAVLVMVTYSAATSFCRARMWPFPAWGWPL